jgi:hypothetical protein
MKKTFRFFAVNLLFVIALNFSNVVKADPPNPPVVPGSHGQSGDTGAPLDGMLGVLLLVLGAAYGGWMLFEKKKKAAGTDMVG